MCNIRSINNPVKQNDIICWHKEQNNLITIVIETKLKGKICPWIMNKFDGVRVFTSGLSSGYLGSGVVIIMNVSLAKHMCKVSKIPGQLISLKLFFKNKLFVSILGLYADASLVAWFFQAGDINSMIAKAINKFSFVILGGNFNEDDSHKCASFKKCLDLGLVNFLSRCSHVKMPMWTNSCGVAKTINFLFISSNLINAVADQNAVSMFVSLGRFLDIRLNSLHKQANRDHWKFNFKDKFATAVRFSDLNAMWDVVHKIIVLLINEMFKKRWFKGFDNVFIRKSSRYHKLEFLVSKIIKTLHVENVVNFDSFMKYWVSLDNVKASVIQNVVDSGAGFGCVCSALCNTKKAYCTSKLTEFLRAKKTIIRAVIDKRIESFEINKSYTIRSVLEHSFYKVRPVIDDISGDWCRQYQLLEYVFDEAFSNVMCSIEFDELFEMISSLPDGKAAGFSGISNELWKYCDKTVLNMLLVFLNSCLFGEFTTCKIFSKILFDRISLACSTFDVLYGDNFLVLKSTITQSSIFAIGLVIENALEKNRKLWMVLQDMRKTYNSIGWKHFEKSLVRIKMYSKFICFFSSIYKGCTNCIMTDFGLTDSYQVHDDLDQGKESVYGYRLNSHFVSKNGSTKSQAELSSFFAVSVFVNDTIWIGSSQNTTQHILDINNVSINNNKTVVIPINSRVSNFSLSINGLPISITKKCKSHRYLGVFLSTESLSKPSLAKVNLDIYFFTNLVLRKAVSDKQLLYLVLAVLYPIVSYRTQFSFNAFICKDLKLKSGLPLNFPSDTIHNPSFYNLKLFFQVQSKSKVASLVSFVNSGGIVGHLFFYKSHNLQVLCWNSVHPLNSPVHIHVSASNNFLAGMICVFLNCNLSLDGFLATLFRFHSGVPMSAVLSESKFLRFLSSLWQHGIAFWFKLSVVFLNSVSFSSALLSVLHGVGSLNILESSNFMFVCDHFSQTGTSSLSVYMDKSLSNLGTASCKAGTATYFEDIGLGLGAIVLALKCVPLSSFVQLFLDSQSVLDACKSELSHSGVSENECVDALAGTTFLSDWYLLPHLNEHFLIANGGIVSGNFRHFVHDIYHSVCHACWKVGSGSKFLAGSLLSKVDWCHSSLVWHPDLNITTGFTSKLLADACTYFMKALLYPNVLCLYCGKVEVLDHVFSCKVDESAQCHLLESYLLLSCISDFSVFTALHKGFVFDSWFRETVSVFHNLKIISSEIVKFVHSLGFAFRTGVWSIHTKHRAYMEKNGLISIDGSVVISVLGSVSRFSADVIKLLGIADAVGICFGFCKSFSVHIAV
ncbi:hypothetical protein G9A89_004766 [Geosiphon pyriformis]|nr:hypothetical protein G9A89_004766 [Geosiphon pyriformis]